MNLVISAVGKKGLQNQWINGDYDVVLFHYEEEGKHYRQGRITHFYKKGFKLELVKEYIEKIGVDNYDYYMIIDDDILIDNNQIEFMFNVAENLGLKLFHPAMAEINMESPFKELHKAEPNVLCKNIAIHDLMCLGVSKDVLKAILPTFTESKSCWGLPPLWRNMFKDDKDLFTVIDAVECLHTRPHQSGGIYTTLGGVEKAQEENKKIVEKYGLEPTRLEVYQRVYDKPILSITTIVSEEDTPLLKQYFETLPEWSEIVVVRTTPKKIDNPIVENIEKYGNKKFIEYSYPEGKFSFSDAMNVCTKNATGIYVMKLDSDERLLTHQHAGLLDILEKHNNTGIKGFFMWTISCLGGDHSQCETIKQVRIVKNGSWVKWQGGSHEFIDAPDGYDKQILNTDLKIDHIGYDITNEEMQKKLIRNIRGMIQNPELMKKEQYFNLLVRDCSFLKNINDYLTKLEGNKNEC